MKKNYVKSMDGMTVSLNEKQALEKLEFQIVLRVQCRTNF